VGQLTFVGDNVKLYVGDPLQRIAGTPAILADVPFFYFNFTGMNQGVSLHGIWNYHGLMLTQEYFFDNLLLWPTSARTGLGSPFNTTLDAPLTYAIDINNYQPVSGTFIPACLNVFPGSEFYVTSSGELNVSPENTSVAGMID